MRTPFVVLLCLLNVSVASGDGKSAPATEVVQAGVITPNPLQDDASLHDVAFVGTKFGWAVGDRGVVWRTRDGGSTWELLRTPIDAPLRCVQFLTDRVGWVAGGGTVPFTRASRGVLLATRDGGETWERLGDGELPRLQHVRFSGLKDGYAIGDATAENPSGVFVTEDGGRRWRPVVGNRAESWRTTAINSRGVGVLGGKQGRVALLAEGRLLESRVGELGLRTLHGASLQDDNGWIVGDGGLILRSTNGGISWDMPTDGLPEDVEEMFDFRAVTARGRHVWIIGSPGSVVWHSPNAGRSWHPQPTGQTAPLAAIAFASDDLGFAVGAFGTILRTTDRGRTWRPVRAGRRRAALLAVHAHPQRVSFRLPARVAAEDGYRTAVLLATRNDVGPGASETADVDLRLHEAVVKAGGSSGRIDWRFPLDLPDLDRNRTRLVDEWNRRSEGRLPRVYLGRLVAAIRTWRPSVIVLDDPPPDDAATKLVNEAVLQAVEWAADPTRFLRQAEIAGLRPWRVRKVYARKPAGDAGSVTIEAYDVLPRLKSTVLAVAAPAENVLLERSRLTTRPEAYRLVRDTAAGAHGITAGRFFAGLAIGHGTEARRAAWPLDPDEDGATRAALLRQRNVHAYAERMLDDPRLAAGLIAQLDGTLRGMSDEQAALLLVGIAREHRRRSQWELAEGTLVELVRRYPDQPVSREAMRWLFQLWSSTEASWQRSRRVRTNRTIRAVDNDAVVRGLQQTIKRVGYESPLSPVDVDEVERKIERSPDPWAVFNRSGRVNNAAATSVVNGRTFGNDWQAGAVKHWQRRAAWMASTMRDRTPELFDSPEIQFPLATLYREREAYRQADAVHRRFFREGGRSPWHSVAQNELWLLNPTTLPPRAVAVCRRATERPKLDGELNDACWRTGTKAIFLTAHDADPELATAQRGYVMLAYDREFLYVAASLPRDPRLPAVEPETAGRTHDADLTPFDRLLLRLDVDRDYTTFYEMEVDERGWTRDACWEDTTWNPKWYVAPHGEDDRWRVEFAIPFEELAPRAPTSGATWSLGLVRTKPAIGLDGWMTPVTARTTPESFGLLRFE